MAAVENSEEDHMKKDLRLKSDFIGQDCAQDVRSQRVENNVLQERQDRHNHTIDVDVHNLEQNQRYEVRGLFKEEFEGVLETCEQF